MIAPRTLALLAAAGLALGLAACGSGASTSSTGAKAEGETSPARAPSQPAPGVGRKQSGGSHAKAGPAGQAAKQPPEPAFRPRAHHDSGGGSGQFEEHGGDNSIQEFGGEASGSEFDEAAVALHGYLDARAERSWSAACRYLATGVAEMLVEQLGGGKGNCAEVLADVSGGLPESALREAAIADAGALRTEGDQAFLLFHGAGGTRYFIPMAQEGGKWKVAAIAASALG